MVTSWDLYDSFHVSEIEPTSKAEGSRTTTGKSSKPHTTKEHDQTMSVSSDRGNIFPGLHFCCVFVMHITMLCGENYMKKMFGLPVWHLKERLLRNLGQVCTETFSVQCHHK